MFESQKGSDHWENLMGKWEDNIKMDFEEIECEDLGWIHVAQDRGRCCEH
jgi:hypothetical protein